MPGKDPANGGTKKQSNSAYNNTYEAIKGLGTSIGQNTVNEIKNIGSGFFDQLTGNYENKESQNKNGEERRKASGKQEFSVFNFQHYHETEVVRREIGELTEQIKKEIVFIKKANKALEGEIKDIEKISIESLPEKPGIYHIRFLEIILSILRLIKSKVHESNTWLQAMISRKKKRGSLFAARSKKLGTQYSLSEEQKVIRQTG